MHKQTRSVFRRVELRVQRTGDSRTVVGLVPYNSASEGLPWIEQIGPGAFQSALTPSADVLMLRDHKQELLMGRTTADTLTLQDTPVGLQFTCVLPNSPCGDDTAEALQRKDLTGVSFGFVTNKDEWSQDAAGQLTRTLLDLELFEISLTSFAAYPSATAALRSVPKQFRSLLKLTTRSNNNGCTCECEECQQGNCPSCSNEDDDCPECIDCPAQDGDDDEDRSKPLTWAQQTRLRLEVLQRL